MSDLSTENLSLSSLGADAGIGTLNVADIPANVRDGDAEARGAYVEGLAFEDVLVKQLASQLVQSASSGDGLDGSDGSADGSDGSDGGSSGSSSGLLGSANSAYSSMIPDTLASSIMSGGGLGIAEEIAESIDPSMAAGSGSATSGSGSATSASGGVGLNGGNGERRAG